MAASDELICSEVHTFTESTESDSSATRVSHFTFSNPLRISSHNDQEINYDSDGDAVVVRKEDYPEDALVIQHDLATNLASVGRQVWRGSLLLADYILHNHKQVVKLIYPCGRNYPVWLYISKMVGLNILELGSGTGLASIVAALCGSSVVATDIPDQNILEIIKANIELNKDILNTTESITVKALDLKTDECNDTFDYILAGDLVYDDSITDALVSFIEKTLAEHKSTKFLVSLEKRYVFTVKDLDTVAPAYQYFIQKLSKAFVKFVLLDTMFKQYFCYDRSKDMVLMLISN